MAKKEALKERLSAIVGNDRYADCARDLSPYATCLWPVADGKPVCVIVPSDREVSMKKLASAFGGKSAQMMKPADAERLSGYKVGGISPFGQSRPPRAAIEEQATAHDLVYINGGQRGLQVRLNPGDAAQVLNAIVAPLVA